MRVRNLSCPYCKKRTTRDKMVNHIEYNHSDQLPEGFTPLRMTFHIANNKPIEYRRPCRVCGNPTEWDEKKGRYNFLCTNPICKEKYVAKMKADMGEKYGAYRPTATAEGLEKMLAARKISGKYKWSDGTVFPYTGSYELETLKFMDKILEIKSEDIMVPGPVLEYQYKGEKHLYISDIYYRPYNLVIEVKDGGSNKNLNKEYGETRAKQMAKEEHVIKHTDYNYIRLTDKDMGQLMAVFGDLKYHLVENDNDRVIHVNESEALAGIAPMVGFNPEKDVVIVNYMKKKTFVDDSDYVIADSPKFDTVYSRNADGILKKSDKSVLLGCYYTPYIVRGRRESIVENLYKNRDKIVSKNFIYETAFGHPMYSKNQIKYESCEEYEDYYQGLENIKEACKDLATARKFASEVKELAKGYNANFYIVTDGASATNNDGSNDAVKYARDTMKEWEAKNGFDPKEDWSGVKESSDISTLDKNFKKKTDKTFFFKDITDSSIDKYLKKDNHIKGMIEWYRKANKKGEVAICKEDDIIIGYILVGNEGRIGPLYVAKKYRGYGVSNTLVDDAVNKFGGKELGVYKDNEIAIRLYKKFGFKKKETNTEEKTGEKYLKMVRESYINEATNELDQIQDPESLLHWMKRNLHYSNFSKLKSWEEVYESKSGSCHDMVMFEKHFFSKFSKIGIKYRTLFCMEYNPGEEQGGRTHSFVYFWDTEDKFGRPLTTQSPYRWFEVAWDSQQGIRTYKSVEEMKADIKSKMLSESNYKDVFFTQFPNIEPGVSLNELVNACSSYQEESANDSEVSQPYFIRSKDGVDNACVRLRDYSKPFRARSSMIILKEQGGKLYVYLRKNKGAEIKRNGKYSVPGGGWNKSERPMDAAIREAQEEAKINVDRVKFCGTLIEYHDTVADWVRQNVDNPNDWWYGYYSRIYVGFYAGKYNGHIDERDKEVEFIKDANFYPYDTVVYDLPGPYADAIDMYIRGDYIKESVEELDEAVTDKDIELNQKLEPVFIVNTYTGTTAGQLIRSAAGLRYSHSLISFNSNLTPMYSFDDNKVIETEEGEKKYKGLIIDTFKRYKESIGNGDLKVIVLLVDTKTKKKIEEAVKYYIDRIDKTKYGYIKLVNYMLGTNTNRNSFGNMSMFCSEFVDSVLKYANIDISNKSSSNTTPNDLGSYSKKNNFFLVYEGKIGKYDSRVTDRFIDVLKKSTEYKDLNYKTKYSMKNPYDHPVGNINHMRDLNKMIITNVKKGVLKEDGTFEYVNDSEFITEEGE